MPLDPGQDMLTIRISVDSNSGQIGLRYLEINQPNFHHRLSFQTEQPLDDILDVKFSNYLKELLMRLKPDLYVVTEPTAIYSTNGLAVGRLRLIARKADTADRAILVRFKYMIGSLRKALQPKLAYNFPEISQEDAELTIALTDICHPIFQSVERAVDGFAEPNDEFNRQKLIDLEAAENDVLFYMQLLKRYVQSTVEGNEIKPIEKQTNLNETKR